MGRLAKAAAAAAVAGALVCAAVVKRRNKKAEGVVESCVPIVDVTSIEKTLGKQSPGQQLQAHAAQNTSVINGHTCKVPLEGTAVVSQGTIKCGVDEGIAMQKRAARTAGAVSKQLADDTNVADEMQAVLTQGNAIFGTAQAARNKPAASGKGYLIQAQLAKDVSKPPKNKRKDPAGDQMLPFKAHAAARTAADAAAAAGSKRQGGHLAKQMLALVGKTAAPKQDEEPEMRVKASQPGTRKTTCTLEQDPAMNARVAKFAAAHSKQLANNAGYGREIQAFLAKAMANKQQHKRRQASKAGPATADKQVGGCLGGAKGEDNVDDDVAAAVDQGPAPTSPVSEPDQLDLNVVEVGHLGSGATSRVTKIRDVPTGKEYALKTVRKVDVLPYAHHLFAEQRVARMVNHSFCVKHYGTSHDKDNLYFVTELMEGGDLMDVLAAEATTIEMRVHKEEWGVFGVMPKVKMTKGMSENLAQYYMACIVLGLEHLHGLGIAHRDIKPDNVFINSAGVAKLGDFGFARQLKDDHRTWSQCGTLGYDAPEIRSYLGYNHSVDWWALGVTLYMLLTGKRPFSEETTFRAAVVNLEVTYPPYVSRQAQDLIGRLLTVNPEKRLGMLAGGASDVKAHPWFNGMDWDALAAGRVTSPRIPQPADKIQRIQDEMKGKEERTATPEELAECDFVFADF